MANISINFYGSSESETDEHFLQCYRNNKNEIYIKIEIPEFESSFIVLDIPTAIKLNKTLRKEINEAKEVYNG